MALKQDASLVWGPHSWPNYRGDQAEGRASDRSFQQLSARSPVSALFRVIQSWKLSAGLRQSLEWEFYLSPHQTNRGKSLSRRFWVSEAPSNPSGWQLLYCQPRPRRLVLGLTSGFHSSPHDEVVPVHIWPITRASQVARVPNHSTAPALLGVPETVGVLAWYNLEQLLQHLIGVV